MNRQRPVPVSGMGCICAAGKNLPDCMQALFTQAPTPAPPRSLPGAQHPVFEVPDRFLPTSDSQNMSMVRAVRLALAATNEALTDAGLIPAALRKKRVGVVIGTNVGSGVSNRALQRDLGGIDCSCLSPAERFLIVNPAQWLARHFDFSGPHVTIVNACSAGSDAIGLAGTWIRSGRCDVVIAGGTDALYEVTYYGFIALLNSDTTACKPFDVHRNGLNLGEGAAMMVLESEAMLTEQGQEGPGFSRGLRNGGRCLPPHRAASGGVRAARCRAGCPHLGRLLPVGHRFYQCAWDGHPRKRPGRIVFFPPGISGCTVRFDQGLYRPHARGRGRHRSGFHHRLARTPKDAGKRGV